MGIPVSVMKETADLFMIDTLMTSAQVREHLAFSFKLKKNFSVIEICSDSDRHLKKQNMSLTHFVFAVFFQVTRETSRNKTKYSSTGRG